jgi:hypothetical protein
MLVMELTQVRILVVVVADQTEHLEVQVVVVLSLLLFSSLN